VRRPAHQTLERYITAIRQTDQLTSFMRDNIDPAAQCQAMRTYRDVIDWGHR